MRFPFDGDLDPRALAAGLPGWRVHDVKRHGPPNARSVLQLRHGRGLRTRSGILVLRPSPAPSGLSVFPAVWAVALVFLVIGAILLVAMVAFGSVATLEAAMLAGAVGGAAGMALLFWMSRRTEQELAGHLAGMGRRPIEHVGTKA